MLLPDKHISISESILGLGCIVLELLTSYKDIDELNIEIGQLQRKGEIEAYHSYENTVLAVSFLYTIGVIDKDNMGRLYRCD